MIQKTTKYEKVKQTFKLNTTYKLQYSTVTVKESTTTRAQLIQNGYSN